MSVLPFYGNPTLNYEHSRINSKIKNIFFRAIPQWKNLAIEELLQNLSGCFIYLFSFTVHDGINVNFS